MQAGARDMDSVLAGSPGFVSVMSPEVKSRVGNAPRVAVDPRQAFTFCAERGGLLVMEYAGPDWLPLVRDLRSLCGGGIAVVVAVRPERMGELSGLQHAGADEIVIWEGSPSSVTWAVERVLAGRAPPSSAPAARADAFAPRAAPPPVLQRAGAAPPAPPAPAAFAVREGPLPAAPPAPAAAPPSPAAAPPSTWPSGVLAAPEAEALLARAVAGAAPAAAPGAEAAVRVARALTALESAALEGAESPVDAGLLCRLAALRLRLALARETAPPAGSPHDAAAVQSLLAEADAALQELKTAAEGAGAEAQGPAEEIRNALVREAIDLTDAVHRLAPAGAPAAALPRAPATRILSNRAGEAAEERPPVRVGWWVVLAIAGIAAAAFHGNRLLNRPPPPARPSVPGAPAGSVSARTPGGAVLVAEPGKSVDRAELERFRQLEEAKGNAVVEVAPGAWVSQPAAPAGGGAKR